MPTTYAHDLFGQKVYRQLAVDPVKMADFKAEAEEEVQLKLDI